MYVCSNVVVACENASLSDIMSQTYSNVCDWISNLLTPEWIRGLGFDCNLALAGLLGVRLEIHLHIHISLALA